MPHHPQLTFSRKKLPVAQTAKKLANLAAVKQSLNLTETETTTKLAGIHAWAKIKASFVQLSLLQRLLTEMLNVQNWFWQLSRCVCLFLLTASTVTSPVHAGNAKAPLEPGRTCVLFSFGLKEKSYSDRKICLRQPKSLPKPKKIATHRKKLQN